jgi:uncharacterized spore protein YtfJ
MTAVPPFEPIAEVFERNINIHHVYGDPVRQGDTTVIPVAKVAYGFGGGGGRRPALRSAEMASATAGPAGAEAHPGVGGGGGARLTPIGAVEVGPHGTRFIRYNQFPRLAGAFALGLGTGMLLASGLGLGTGVLLASRFRRRLASNALRATALRERAEERKSARARG